MKLNRIGISFLSGCVLLLGTGSAYAVEIEKVNLADAVSIALSHAPKLQAARANRDASAEDATVGRAFILPRIAAHGSYTQKNQNFSFDNPNAFMKPTIRNREKTYGITLFQPLFDLESWAAFEQGSLSSETGELKLQMLSQQTTLQVAAAWLDVMRAKAAFLSAEAGEKAMSRLALQAQAAFDVGTLSVNESLSANSRRDLAKSGRIYASQILRNAESQLSSLVGKNISTTIRIKEHVVPLKADPDDEELWLNLSQKSSLEVLLSQKALDLAEMTNLQAKGGAAPKINFVAGLEHNVSSDGSFGGSTLDASAIGIEISMPLFAGGGTWAALRKTTHQKVSAEFELQEAKRVSQLNTQNAWLSLQSTASEIQALEAAVKSATTEKKAAEDGYQVGLRNIVEALDAEERLASAKQRYADALARHAMAYLQLHAAVGILSEETVAVIDAWLRE